MQNKRSYLCALRLQLQNKRGYMCNCKINAVARAIVSAFACNCFCSFKNTVVRAIVSPFTNGPVARAIASAVSKQTHLHIAAVYALQSKHSLFKCQFSSFRLHMCSCDLRCVTSFILQLHTCNCMQLCLFCNCICNCVFVQLHVHCVYCKGIYNCIYLQTAQNK